MVKGELGDVGDHLGGQASPGDWDGPREWGVVAEV